MAKCPFILNFLCSLKRTLKRGGTDTGIFVLRYIDAWYKLVQWEMISVQIGNRKKSVSDSPNSRKSAVQIRNSAYPFSPEVTWSRLSFYIKTKPDNVLIHDFKVYQDWSTHSREKWAIKNQSNCESPCWSHGACGCENVARKLRQEW